MLSPLGQFNQQIGKARIPRQGQRVEIKIKTPFGVFPSFRQRFQGYFDGIPRLLSESRKAKWRRCFSVPWHH